MSEVTNGPRDMNDATPAEPVPAGRAPQPVPTPAKSIRNGNADWASALIVTCLALGLVLGWGNYELNQRWAADNQTSIYRHDLDLLSSEQGELGALLADPGTRFFRLQTADSRLSPVRLAAVAWNDDRQRGALFCDNLAPVGDGQQYQIWLIPDQGSAQAAAISLSNPSPGQTVYAFTPMGRLSPRRIVLTVGRPVTLLREADTQLGFASVE
ncbi:MAG TPA: anti-sigma factor [Tepidisphaeraceae bacterium]|nr:anti-sigma factor [Tepidisphaeraceae bacterium]